MKGSYWRGDPTRPVLLREEDGSRDKAASLVSGRHRPRYLRWAPQGFPRCIDRIDGDTSGGERIDGFLDLVQIGAVIFELSACRKAERERSDEPDKIFAAGHGGDVVSDGLECVECNEELLVLLRSRRGGEKGLQRADHVGQLRTAESICHAVEIADGRRLGGEFVGGGFHGDGDGFTGEAFDGGAEKGRVIRESLDDAEAIAKEEDADAKTWRDRAKVFDDTLTRVGLILRGGVEGVHEQEIDGLIGLGGGDVGKGVGREGRRGWCGLRCRREVRLEILDGLRLAALEDLEVFFVETGDGDPFLIGDHDVDKDVADVDLERGGRGFVIDGRRGGGGGEGDRDDCEKGESLDPDGEHGVGLEHDWKL